MPNVNATAWKADNYKFVGKAFDFAYADRLNKLTPILGSVNSKSIDYEMAGIGGFGELTPYDGENLNMGEQKRAFKTIITPEEFTKSAKVGYKQAKVDKLGETKKVGTRLGDSAALTVYLHALRMFGRAFDAAYTGGDGKPFAATDHPVASMRGEGRRYIVDPDAGTYSNLITASVVILIAFLLLLTLSNELDVLTLGDENAKSLGLNTGVMRTLFLMLSAALAGTAVSIAGLLSFVGLLVPHAVRRISTGESRHLIPLCGLFGAGFVTLCDTLARTVFAPYELPVGIIMAFLGAPFFLFILIKGKGGHSRA